MSTREPAIVESVTYGEGHYGLSSDLYMIGPDGGWGQSFGGLCLNDEFGAVWKADLCALFGVDNFEAIKGRRCFVLRSWPTYGSTIEGVEVGGKRFTITGFRRKVVPERAPTPLEQKTEILRADIDRAARNIQDLNRRLASVVDGYVDWTVDP